MKNDIKKLYKDGLKKAKKEEKKALWDEARAKHKLKVKKFEKSKPAKFLEKLNTNKPRKRLKPRNYFR